ncbi:MAG TPA: hypothetical protein VFD58_00075 [Blastocatellia bacterium]|nr:hypothetical protein [Blastocatellia bacterium]
MTDELIPEDVRQFILRNIDSVAQLEALLLLRGSPQSGWCARTAAEQLYIGEQEAAPLLGRLCEQGFVTASSGEPARYQYQPDPAELAGMVDRVAEVYAKHLAPVTNLIHARPRSRIQEFADAFKLRKDE